MLRRAEEENKEKSMNSKSPSKAIFLHLAAMKSHKK
jgi:hypothetical protein